MAEEKVSVPIDFARIYVNFPAGIDRQLGYHGPRRWVGFRWDDEEDDVAWTDGADSSSASGQWEAWTRFVAHIGPAVRHHLLVPANLGGSEDPATHLLLWDRLEQAAYIAPREEAEEFLTERAKAEGK